MIDKLIYKICILLFKLIPEHRLAPLLENLINRFVPAQKQFISYHQRPIYSDQINIKSDSLKNPPPKISCILQGPILTENNFTLETIKLYKKTMPEVEIILSTWDDENEHALSKIKKENIPILLNQKPKNPGQQNINYQIVSTQNGIELAKSNKASYILKTRTDQRLYATSIPEFLLNYINLFPLKQTNKQQQRIIGISLNTFKYRLYNISDMTLFGTLKDMQTYWSPPLDNRAKITISNYSLIEYSKARYCETYLCSKFLESTGKKLQWTLADSWHAIAEHFCVIDKECLDIFWPKYANRYLEHRHHHYDVNRTNQELSFKDWINLYQNSENKLAPESVLQKKFNQAI